MSILKIDLENVQEDLTKVGHMLFGEGCEIEVLDDTEYVDSEVKEYDTIIHVHVLGENEKIIKYVSISQIHKQYDFQSEKLFGFYDCYGSSGGFDWDDFYRVARTFNKKV